MVCEATCPMDSPVTSAEAPLRFASSSAQRIMNRRKSRVKSLSSQVEASVSWISVRLTEWRRSPPVYSASFRASATTFSRAASEV